MIPRKSRKNLRNMFLKPIFWNFYGIFSFNHREFLNKSDTSGVIINSLVNFLLDLFVVFIYDREMILEVLFEADLATWSGRPVSWFESDFHESRIWLNWSQGFYAIKWRSGLCGLLQSSRWWEEILSGYNLVDCPTDITSKCLQVSVHPCVIKNAIHFWCMQ